MKKDVTENIFIRSTVKEKKKAMRMAAKEYMSVNQWVRKLIRDAK